MPFSTIALCLLFVSADLPAEKFNLSGQHRTRTCVEMRGKFVALRFADGTPTGFWASADDPSQQGSAQPCRPGTMEIDAHERLASADDLATYFHPGGGPDQYLKNYIENGQYGHIAREDLQGAIKLIPSQNGKSAPVRSGRTYFVTPTRIPEDMWYKPNVSGGKSGARYFTYGNPGYDKTYGRGDWTYISWSWVQTGGADYASNKFGGGGIARAMLKRGMGLAACDVQPILGISWGENNQENGRVTAFYARAFVGPGEKGSAIYGWLPHSYQRNDDLIVPCIRRTPEGQSVPLPLSALKSTERDRMTRMALNLLNELKADEAATKQGLAYWERKYEAEKDPLSRMELLTEMSRIDRPATVTKMLEMATRERDLRVREQAIVLVGFMRSAESRIEAVCQRMQEMFAASDSMREKLRILDVMSNIPRPETVELVRRLASTVGESQDKFELHTAVADAVLKLSMLIPVDEKFFAEAIEPLQRHAKDGRSRALRKRMVRVLAAPGRKQLDFLLGLLETEESAEVRETINEMTANLKRKAPR
ncbi:MAG: hypothetical protein WD063_03145 [Pirellulales bacterium]